MVLNHRSVQQVSDTIGGKVRSSIVGIHVEQDVSYVNPYSFGVYDLITTDEKTPSYMTDQKGLKNGLIR
jgi:hypothetical protein